MEPAADKVDPIHQFGITHLIDFGTIGGVPLAFTNSALFMVVTVLLISGFLISSTAGRAIVPGRLQTLAQISYEFVAKMVRDSAGSEGMRFFPFVFSLFMFVLVANVLGVMPYFFTVTSHIVITAALALTVMLIVVVYGFYRNGLGFLKLFVPHGVPGLLPLVVAIEVLSFLSRPISLSVRLFANMLAGHITLKVFASFILMPPELAVGCHRIADRTGEVMAEQRAEAHAGAAHPDTGNTRPDQLRSIRFHRQNSFKWSWGG